MTDNFDINKKLIPYKEILKKRALEYYYENKEAMSQKEKNINRCHLKTKKRLLSINNGQSCERREIKQKASYIIKIDMII